MRTGTPEADRGRVLILNGVSSSGKTTAARALQSALPDAWVVLSMDQVTQGFPSGDHLGARSIATVSRAFALLEDGLRDLVSRLAHGGVDVIVDTVLQRGGEDQRAWNAALTGLDVAFLGIHADPTVVTARESARPDRPAGLAATQQSLHQGVQYELRVDTTELTPTALVHHVHRITPDILEALGLATERAPS